VHAHDAVADVGHRPDVAGLEAVRREGLLGALAEIVDRIGALHHADVARIQEAAHVLAEPEHRGPAVGKLVGADAFEGAQAVVEGVGQDVDLGGVPVHELPVHPDRLELVHHGGFLRQKKGPP